MNKVELINYSLYLIGETGIESLDEGSKKAKVASGIYPLALYEFLGEYTWYFATKRTTLALVADDNKGEFKYSFYFPSDYIRVVDVDFNENSKFRVEGNLIYYSSDSITLRYVFKQEDLNKFHPKALTALAYNLASKLIYIMFRDSKDIAMFEQKYLIALERAKQFDGGNYIGLDNSSEDGLTWQNI